ncbi:hypothetical protein RJ641_017011 [Dillenia turbinata]|uniref:C2H2-type domain-containing protein n=1 Tax=Dillenia turbinata TaxID=194707 RepID=A0AAN8UT00_9MAGN
MRAHGIGDEAAHLDDDDPASDWEDNKLGGNAPSNKRMYALRTNPNRLKSCRVCENCGEEFLSWKAFLEHGKCSSDDVESFVSFPGSDGEDGGPRRGCGTWSKRKRSLRAKVGNYSPTCPSSEEEDLANCLVMLSNARVDPFVVEPEESCASASKEEERRNPVAFVSPITAHRIPMDKAKGVVKGMFECKACKKVFNSHQALGGHRASHKKVKGCFAARLDRIEDSVADDDVITHEEFLMSSKSTSTLQFDHGLSTPSSMPPKRKSKVHECSICHRIFSSGQALGGHKRCHWITSNSQDTSSLAKFHQFHEHHLDHQIHPRPKFTDPEPHLDLNLPAPAEDMTGIRRDPRNPLSFEVSTEIYLQPWTGIDSNACKEDSLQHYYQQQAKEEEEENNRKKNNTNNNNENNHGDGNASLHNNVDDEADSKVKLAKLSDVKDMSMSGESSPWLQVGIGSTTNVGADP